MGVIYQRPPLRITLDSPEFDGLVVFARRLTVAETRNLTEGRGELTRVEHDHAIETIVADAVQSWNYADEAGEPIDPTAENLDRRVDPAFVGELVDELIRRSNRVAPPLPQRSDGGSPSVEQSIPMEPLSSDPPNSPGPN